MYWLNNFSEYRSILKKTGIQRRFQKIDVAEPSVEEAYKIMFGLKANMKNIIRSNIVMKL